VKRVLLSFVAGVLMLGLSPVAQAQGTSKPILVVSISGFQELKDDITYLAKATDNGDKTAPFDAVVDGFTTGLDKQKSIGAIVTMDGDQPSVVGFIPVKNLNQLLGSLAAVIGPTKDAGNGLKSVGGGTAFIKEQDGYAFLAQKASQLQNLPDPVKALGTLPKQYDIAIEANIQNIPKEYRTMGLGFMKQGLEAQLNTKQDNETDAQFEFRKQMAATQIKQIERFMDEGDRITFGWSVDRTGKKTFLDFVITAVRGSKLAQQLATLKESTTKFSGLLKGDAPIAMSMAIENKDPEEIDNAVAQIRSYKETLLDMIEDSDEFEDDDQKKLVKGWASQAMDIVQKTVEAGRFDAALAFTSPPGSTSTLLAGVHTVDGKGLEKIAMEVLKMAEKEQEDFPKVQYNVTKHGAVNLHALAIPIPQEDAENFRKIFGDKPMLYLGFSPDTVWLAAGTGSLDPLKVAIDASGERKPTTPMMMTASLGSIMRLAAEVNKENPALMPLANAIQPGSDHVRMLVEAIDSGERIRFEVEEGVLKLIGMGAKLQKDLEQ